MPALLPQCLRLRLRDHVCACCGACTTTFAPAPQPRYLCLLGNILHLRVLYNCQHLRLQVSGNHRLDSNVEEQERIKREGGEVAQSIATEDGELGRGARGLRIL
jgi:hypothetical protein